MLFCPNFDRKVSFPGAICTKKRIPATHGVNGRTYYNALKHSLFHVRISGAQLVDLSGNTPAGQKYDGGLGEYEQGDMVAALESPSAAGSSFR